MNNDKVTVRILHSGDGRHKQEGEIVSIVERANKTLVGTFQLESTAPSSRLTTNGSAKTSTCPRQDRRRP